MTRWFVAALPLAALLFVTACSQNSSQPAPEAPADTAQPATTAETHDHGEGEHGEEMEGFAIALAPTKGSQATGTLMVMNMGDGVHISGVVAGLEPGPHAIHIHEKADCSAPDASSAGGHFNPGNSSHGAPDKLPHHAGDLGNVVAGQDGRAEINVHVNGLSMKPGENSIVGRAFIIHAAADDFTTQPTGNAGARVACGAIEGTQ